MTKMRLIAIKYFNRLTALVIIICKGYYMFNTCKLCSEYLYRVYVMLCYTMLCYVMLCYVMVGCCAVPCPKNFSAQSDPVSFCASDNKRLVTCNLEGRCLLPALVSSASMTLR